MKEIFKLALGVVFKPVFTFRQIGQQKPFLAGLIMLLLAFCLNGINTFIIQKGVAFEKTKDFFSKFGIIYEKLSIVILCFTFLIILFLAVAILNFICQLFKTESNYRGLLASSFFIIAVTSIVGLLIDIPFIFLKLNVLHSILSSIISFWVVALVVIAVKEITGLSLLHSIYACVVTFIVMATLMLSFGKFITV